MNIEETRTVEGFCKMLIHIGLLSNVNAPMKVSETEEVKDFAQC